MMTTQPHAEPHSHCQPAAQSSTMENNNTINNNKIWRPTEGQLRWAQFHHKRRATKIRAAVAELWQRPASPSQVEEALLPDDAASSSAGSSNVGSTDITQRERAKPKISRGRRALLRVSQRRFRARQARIAEHGFQGGGGQVQLSSSGSGDTENDSNNHDDDALAWIFAETAAWKKRRQHRRYSKKDARGRRFDQAFAALLRRQAAAQQPQFAAVDTPTKIWTRPRNDTPGLQNPDTVNYDALRLMGIPSARRGHSTLLSQQDDYHLPLDKGASWLVHLPKTHKASNAHRLNQQQYPHDLPYDYSVNDDEPDTQPPTTTHSPVRQRFRDICSDFQKPPPPSAPTFLSPVDPSPSLRLHKYLAQLQQDESSTMSDEKKEEDQIASPAAAVMASPLQATRLEFGDVVQQRIQAMESGTASPKCNNDSLPSDQLEAWMESMDPELLQEMEAMNPGVQERLRALYLGESSPSVKQLARLIESPPEVSGTAQKMGGLVMDCVARFERASKQQDLTTADGKLHKPTFAKLLNQYLLEARGTAVSPRRRQPLVDSLVSKFQESAETESILDGNGHLDTPVLTSLLTKYLSQVTGQPEADVSAAQDWEGLTMEETYRERPPFIRDTARELRERVAVVMPRGEAAWCQVVSSSMEAALPRRSSSATTAAVVQPPLLAVRRMAERCAALVPAAWEQINTIEEVVESTLEDVREEVKQQETEKTPATPMAASVPTPSKITPSPQVRRLVGHLERAADVEPLVQEGGTLHMPTFTKIVHQHWNETTQNPNDFANAPTPVLLARAKRSSVLAANNTSSGTTAANNPFEMTKSPETVQRFLANVQALAPQRPLITAQGTLDHQALEDFVTEELYKASIEGQRDVVNEVASPQDSDVSDFFAIIRRRRAERDTATQTVVTLESSSQDAAPEETKGSQLYANAVTNRVGGLIGRLFHRDNNDESSVDRQEEDLQAVAHYRKKQDERRLSDDTSSLSSFRALPDGIKNVVLNFRRASAGTDDPPRADEEATDTVLPNEEQSHGRSGESDTATSQSRVQSGNGGESSDFSPERVRNFHKKVMEKSALIGGANVAKGIIDTDGSDISAEGINPGMLATLLLSPTILTKRHQQAMRAIEKRKWEQVTYLINANPWLCEMTDVTTNQYLLHKLSLYGGGESATDRSTGESMAIRYAPAPAELNTSIVKLFPSAVQKFDQDGNLPLHMACAAANASMVEILGDRFPGGATVRNEDGLLPIHLVILACGSPLAGTYGNSEAATAMVRTMLNLFPASVAISDEEGNLPIHTAASVLRGDVGVDVIHLLLDEATRQLEDPYGARFRNKVTMEAFDDATVETEPTDAPTVSDFDEITHCTAVANDAGQTALMAAIHARAGWEIIDTLMQGTGGPASALVTDVNMNNALHLLVSEDYQDPAAALSILKNAPETAHHRNEYGMLPIEIACMHSQDPQLILAIALVDLPIEIDSKETVKVRENQGASWWYLVCESDDHFVSVVDEVVSMCSYLQVRELCFMEGYNGETLISRATPKCREVLQKGLRFLGRFEFVGQSAILADPSRGIKIFEAIDFGPSNDAYELGKRVILKCYADESTFLEESKIPREVKIDYSLFEEVAIYSVSEDGSSSSAVQTQVCIAIERPQLTLGGVVSGMLGNEDCQTNEDIRRRYAMKVFSVLRVVCKALSSLHADGLVHGNISVTHIGKYESKWKVAEVLGLQRVGTVFDPNQFSPSSPPESLIPRRTNAGHEVAFRTDLETNTAIDVWGFGKMAFEALVGEPLVLFDETKEFDDDHRALMDILHWNEFNLEEVAYKLRRSAVPEEGVNLVVACLSPTPTDRPSVDALLDHALWREIRRQSK